MELFARRTTEAPATRISEFAARTRTEQMVYQQLKIIDSKTEFTVVGSPTDTLVIVVPGMFDDVTVFILDFDQLVAYYCPSRASICFFFSRWLTCDFTQATQATLTCTAHTCKPCVMQARVHYGWLYDCTFAVLCSAVLCCAVQACSTLCLIRHSHKHAVVISVR
jgi:hypothetical protein